MREPSPIRRTPLYQAAFRPRTLAPEQDRGRNRNADKSLLEAKLQVPITKAERQAVGLIESVRPKALREYDQIPMLSRDLLRQTKLMTPLLADKAVAFMGDFDCTSLLLGLLGDQGSQLPARMMLLDFDERLLDVANNLAYQYGFDNILQVRAYNVFDALPEDLLGGYDWFYTNPPYGSYNNGASGQLFVTRGCELTRPGGSGCIILPYDATRRWTQQSMLNTQSFLSVPGWVIRVMLDQMHRYHLDDDKRLASALMLLDDVIVTDTLGNRQAMRYAGRNVELDEISTFYGRHVSPPYPRYIRRDGSLNRDWNR